VEEEGAERREEERGRRERLALLYENSQLTHEKHAFSVETSIC
jgi:hypothetical protein